MDRALRPTTAPPAIARRAFVGGVALSAFAASGGVVHLGSGAEPPPLRLSIPGKIVKIVRANTLQPNGLWPTEDAARVMFERAMTELTGKPDLGSAFAEFLRPSDRVAVKLNGIAGRHGSTMATNKELILQVVRGIVAAGIPAENITLYEQFKTFLSGTRVTDPDLKLDPAFPSGVVTTFHDNNDAVVDVQKVCNIPTRYVRALTQATAVINVSLIKDHSICGYTGCLKNITHGSIINPGAFHEHVASPQIAELYAQSVVKSRVVLHIVDGYKIIYEGGPLDRNPERRIPHEAIYVSTDPVALDTVGWAEVERLRSDKALPSLKSAGREPSYIRIAAELGLGFSDLNRIHVREVRL
ncbi:MAG: DUF362 domain-containing protein [Polyangiaceae bacterium]|nr:DUF362 domain-containing protein [Polyangiaceae bacterium]